MNYKGWKAYNDKRYIPVTTSTSTGIQGAQGHYVDSDFKRFIDRLGGKGAISSDRFGPNQRVNVGNYGVDMLMILQQQELQDMMLQELLSMTTLLQVINKVI